MPRYAYVNGRYVPFGSAAVHVEDRGLQLADGVYEVVSVVDTQPLDRDPHLDRLERSLGELDITPPMSRSAMEIVIDEVIRRERVQHGMVYIQVTRGVARRDHAFPVPERRPGLVIMARAVQPQRQTEKAARGISVVSVPETRWSRVDIKTTALTGNVLARQAAIDSGADEAWFVDSRGAVTEGASSNAWIISPAGSLVTHPADGRILRGITREITISLAESEGLRVEEQSFTIAEAQTASEAFITSAGNGIMPVVRIDGSSVGDGTPGPVATMLRRRFDARSGHAYV